MGAGASGMSAETKTALMAMPEPAQKEIVGAMTPQAAFVFVKPHANTPEVNSLVKGKVCSLPGHTLLVARAAWWCDNLTDVRTAVAPVRIPWH